MKTDDSETATVEAGPDSLFCSVCDGKADLDLKLGTLKCRHCGNATPADATMLERLRAHEQRLREQQANADSAAATRDLHERTAARFKMPWPARAGFALLAFLWFFVSITACMGVIFTLLPVTERSIGLPEGGILAGFLGISVYAALMWAPNLLTVRRRAIASSLHLEIDLRQTCPRCGAKVPLNTGAVAVCPFCNGNLIASDRSREEMQDTATTAVAREHQRSNAAAAVAEKSGAQRVQEMLRIPQLISLPVVFVALPVGLGQLVARLAFRYIIPADLFGRNQIDIISVAAGGVFIVATIATTIVIAVRMDTPKKNREQRR